MVAGGVDVERLEEEMGGVETGLFNLWFVKEQTLRPKK